MASSKRSSSQAEAIDHDEEDFKTPSAVQKTKRTKRTKRASNATANDEEETERIDFEDSDLTRPDMGIGNTSSFETDEYGAIDMRHALELKPDHPNRPILVTPDGQIFLETFSPIYKQAYDFLIAIAEPICRPEHIHEYRITSYSLYAAASVGIQTDDIMKYLDRLCKTDLPLPVRKDIRTCTERYGKVKLVLRSNRYIVETNDEKAISDLLKNPVIRNAKIDDSEVQEQRGGAPSADKFQFEGQAAADAARLRTSQAHQEDGDELSDEALVAAADATEELAAVPKDILDLYDRVDEFAADTDKTLFSFEIKKEHVESVQAECAPSRLDYPLIGEYDFRRDQKLRDLKIDLKPTCILRPYQEKSLSKMFGRTGQARSGIIVLPCGAGKTLTGVTAVSTIKKRAIVLCTSTVAVEQWCSEFRRWCNVDPSIIRKFTRDDKELPPEDCIICCTYSMLAPKKNRSEEAARVINFLRKREWGIMVLDEVQTVPAAKFRALLTEIPSHCKLGLTATLVREDGKIDDLRFLVGPKLYEANWMDLQAAGHIARVQCIEVWCRMTEGFYEEYLRGKNRIHLKRQLCVCNPIKFMYCEYLIRLHEARQDKIIVFSDDKFALRTLAMQMGKEHIDGDVPDRQRHDIINRYKTTPSFRTIFFSKIADNAFDLPEANVLIQISSHGGSRRQEAQRLGRILRKKKNDRTKPGEYNAYFYSLVSQDTLEMAYATKRQRFLVDQGYAYKVMKYLPGFEDEGRTRPYAFGTEHKQTQLLSRILANKMPDEEGRTSIVGDDDDDLYPAAVQRRATSLSSFSGANNMVYQEIRARTKKNEIPAWKKKLLK